MNKSGDQKVREHVTSLIQRSQKYRGGPGGGGERVGQQGVVVMVTGWLCVLIRVVATQVCTHRVCLQRLHTHKCLGKLVGLGKLCSVLTRPHWGTKRLPGFGAEPPVHRASLVAQLVKNPPAGQEAPAQCLGWEDPLEKGIGCPRQCSWASLMVQTAKNQPAVWEPWVGKLPWKREKATHSSILNPHWQRSLVGCSAWGHKESDTTERSSGV